ncbi:F-box protein SKIP23-like [Miscanthus floridulus]|uniref:F-box protein SKIP23-like n=1 Tax=Miscanthus floridulus TaxID=154761 RepID=UPI00345A5EBA
MASAQDPWSNIPLDLAGLVLKRLPAHVDRVRFAAVCPQWRSAARQLKLPPPRPLLALKAGDIFYSMPRGEPLNFAGYKNGHLDGCRKGFYTACGNWLVYRRIDDLLLLDPFSGATMTLPPPDSFHDTDMSEKLFMDVRYSQVIKLMVCSPNLIDILFQGKESNRIAVCRPGCSMWSVARDLSLWITDMAFYQGKLYVVDYHEDLLALVISVDDNTGDPWVARIGRVINVGHFDDQRTLLRMLYLVESCGSLLLVRRRNFHTHVYADGQIHTFAGQYLSGSWNQFGKVLGV